MARLTPAFFQRDPVVCARELIGARFIWDGCEGRIVETEAYAAEGDEACHTFFRPGARAFVEAHPAGTAYVYLNYGIHWLFNVLVKGSEGNGFVLFRALEPINGIETMLQRRGGGRMTNLCSGPGKLTRALGIDGSVHGQPFLEATSRAIISGPVIPVVAGERVGISRAQAHPWRFYEPENAHVSR
jgi:DNA-3-methyladenine glycosylase